jgi:predicted DsbA family dithiol-disulfide isomerase
MNAPAPTIRLDIVSDVVCPWCVIGWRQLQQALDDSGGELRLEVRWHPFELNPEMPHEGQDLVEHVGQKYGSTPAQSRAARARISALGESLGFTFAYAEGARIYNTFKAHQLLHWAGVQGRQTDLQLALFDACFTRRQNVAEPMVLVEAAERIGLDGAVAAAVLRDGRFGDEVRRGEQYWQERGIQGVPAFVFDRRHLISGAQGIDVFANALAELAAEQVACGLPGREASAALR